MKKNLNILFIESDKEDIKITQDFINEINRSTESKFNINRFIINDIDNIDQKFLDKKIDFIVFDVSNEHTLEVLDKMHKSILDYPTIILTDKNCEKTSAKALQKGVQDYLIKGQVSTDLLIRSIRYSIERHKLISALKEFSFLDELTGLYNRRGFINLAKKHLKVAVRENEKIMVIYFDLDNLKQINDEYGHLEGDNAILDFSNILKLTFRSSDLLSRFGGDEFVIFGIDGRYPDINEVFNRLNMNMNEVNQNRKYELSVSKGYIFDYAKSCDDLEELIEKADNLMYQDKKNKK